MRDFLDNIFELIEAESLTDEEFGTIELDEPPAYSKAMYEQLRAILEARENLSNQVKRLKLFFISAGVDLSSTSSVPTPHSNIYLGEPL